MQTDVQFTEESRRILVQEAHKLAEDLEREAVEEAMRARGRPIEVTGSDVRRARAIFVKRQRPMLPLTQVVVRAYTVVGMLLFVGGIAFPVFREFVWTRDPVVKVSFGISVFGLGLAILGWFFQGYLARQLEFRSWVRLRTYDQEREGKKEG